MIDFDFVNPTRIIFGKNKENEIASILKDYGFSRVLVVYGGGSVIRSGLLQKTLSLLDEAEISHVEMSGVLPNPERDYPLKGVEIARKNRIDCLLAIGGGSVIDVAKSIAAGFYYAGDPFDFNLKKATPTKALPIGVILTIAAAGSESSNSCVIQDNETKIKKGFNSDLVRPLFAIEDPLLTFEVPPYQTAAGIADIMMHSMERFFDPSGDYQLSDDWALALVKNVMEAGKAVIKNLHDYDARAALMLDSSLSHDGLTSIGKTQAFVVHPLEHAISGYKKEVTHGAGIAICYLGWAKYWAPKEPTKFARLARALFNINGKDEKEVAIMGVKSMKDFYVSIGLPISLEELGLAEDDIPALVNLATGNGTRVVGLSPQPLDSEAVKEVYFNCLK